MKRRRADPRTLRSGVGPPAGPAPCGVSGAGSRPAASLLPVVVLALLAAAAASAQTPPGTLVSNTATATYDAGGLGGLTALSNTHEIVTTAARTPAALEFLRLTGSADGTLELVVAETAFSLTGTAAGPFATLAVPQAATLRLHEPVPARPAELFRRGDTILLRVHDPDQNLDPVAVDHVLVSLAVARTADREVLRLTETESGAGIFTGFVGTAGGDAGAPGDGVLTVATEAVVLGRYQDPAAPDDVARDDALIDPLSRVFDAGTGAAVDGVRLTLVDAASGLPAVVRGDDGTSRFPATIVSGGTATDAGGAVYDFPPGSYRFPRLSPGSYRLQVDPPAGYLAPSEADPAGLQTLPGAPWHLDDPGSRGGAFALREAEPLWLDVPVDRTGGDLFLAKRADRTDAAPGEFVVWELNLVNNGDDDASDVTIDDELPRGVRLRPGTVRVDGADAPDPEVAADGATLVFRLPALAAGAAVRIRYLTVLDVAAARGRIVSTARAVHAGLASNRARATVHVRDELFADRVLLTGRVVARDCAAAVDSTAGVAGVRVYLEDGTNVVTDERGRYHFEDVRPGAHVVQLDTATLPPRFAAGSCDADERRAEHPFARMIDVQGGSLWRVDFPVHVLPPATGEAAVALEVDLSGRDLAGTATVVTEGVAVRNRRLSVLLPTGTVYVPGSSRRDGAALADPEDRGGALTWRLGDAAAGRREVVTFAARADSVRERRDLALVALLTVDTPAAASVRTPPARAVVGLVPETTRVPGETFVLRPHFGSLRAELGAADRAAPDTLTADLARRHLVHLSLVGHSDSQGIPAAKRHVFANNYALGLARARAVADHLAARLDLPPERVTVASRGPDEPVDDNATAAGRARNRRVVVQAWTERELRRLPDRPVRDRGGGRVDLVGLRPGETWAAGADPSADPERMPVYDMAWLERAAPGFALLWPPPGHLPAMPSFKAAVKHDAAWRVTLAVNGVPVDELNRDGTATNAAGTLAVTRWAGVDLREGDNVCIFTARDATGRVATTETRVLHLSGPPVRVELAPEASELVAAGRRPAVVAVRLTDRDGYPVRRGLIGEYSVDAPYEPERLRSEDRKAALGALEEPRTTYTVGRDGIARIRLEPTTRSGEALLRFRVADRHEEIRAWLAPEDRDWILVGLAEGTAGWNAVSGNLESLADDGVEEEFWAEGRLAFFARGRVKGEWLLTAAYESRRDPADPDDGRLFGAVDPDAFYTVYGDASVQGHDAASREKLYVRLERDRFYALFGDYATGLTVTELSRYNRRLTGLQTGLRAGAWDVAAFAADSRQGYGREELRGDGTSGIYRLAAGDLLVNSEQVTIETRDRYRSEVVLDARRLTRFVDYDIDFVRGELTFREPIHARDEDFNPIFIVVEYETRDERDPQLQAGGRVAAHLAGDRVELGATAIHEGAHGTAGDLAGLDARLDVNDHLELRGELAGSDTGTAGRAGAYRLEAVHRSRSLEARGWLRRQESGFGLGQQRFGEAGMLKYGLDADWRFLPGWRLGGRALREENLLSGAARDLVESRLAWQQGPWTAHLGHRQAVDRFATAPDARSLQLRAGASAALMRTRLRLSAEREQSLGGEDANPDYPSRTALGAEYQVVPQAALFARTEWTEGARQDTRSNRMGVRATPWRGGEVATSLEQRYHESALRVYRNAGIKQSWHLDERWSLDAGLDYAQVAGDPGERVNPDVPPAIGADEGYTAASAGATCRGHEWRWVQRVEYRNGASEDKWGVDGSVFVEPSASLGLQAGARVQAVEENGGSRRLWDWRVGLAWRPPGSPWTLLQRLDHRTETQTGADPGRDHWRIVHNLNVNWRGHPWLQLAGRHGFRFARETYAGVRHDAYTDLIGLEARWFFARHWDVGLQAAARNSWSEHVHDLSCGVALGRRLLEDVWLAVGYNAAGFRDRDFSGGYTAQGPYLRFRLRFNQDSKHEMLF